MPLPRLSSMSVKLESTAPLMAVVLDYSDVKAMTAELQKIGTNINQIAKRVNATRTLYAQDIEDIKGAMAEIWQLQRSILSKAP